MITPMWNRWDWGFDPFSELRLMERRSAKNQVMHKTKHEVAETRDLPVATPAVNLYEREHEVVIVADLPGVSEKNIDITIERHTLTISGKTDWTEPAGYDLRYREFTPAEFRRAITLTSELDAENIKAVMKHGVLTLTLPKSEKAKPRKIAVASV